MVKVVWFGVKSIHVAALELPFNKRYKGHPVKVVKIRRLELRAGYLQNLNLALLKKSLYFIESYSLRNLMQKYSTFKFLCLCRVVIAVMMEIKKAV